MFASNEDQGLSYFTTESVDFIDPMEVVPLIPEGQGGTFSPFIASKTATQQLIISTPSATELTMLQQDMVSGLWKTKKLYVPSLDEMIEFDAYMTRIFVKNDEKEPVANEDFVLKSPEGFIDIDVNGRSVIVGPEGVNIRSDPQGSIILVIPTDDIDAYQFTLENNDYLPNGYEIDPMAKVHHKLDSLNSGDALRNAKDGYGKPLLESSDLSDDEIDEIGKALCAVNNAKKNLSRTKKKSANEDKDYKLIAGKAPSGWGGGRKIKHFGRVSRIIYILILT